MATRTFIPGQEGVVITGHAVRRAQQRGVKEEAIFLTAVYGEVIRAPGGSERRTMTKKVITRLRAAGFDSRLLDETSGTVLITCDDAALRTVLTVRPTEKDGKRRGGVHKPRYGEVTKTLPKLSSLDLGEYPYGE